MMGHQQRSQSVGTVLFGVLAVVLAVCTSENASDAAPPLADWLSGGIGESSEPGAVPPHSHDPIRVDARPIVERLSLPVSRPRSLLFGRDSSLYVADQTGGVILRRDPLGNITTIAEQLDEPTALAWDRRGRLHVACYAGGLIGQGAIFRIDPDGTPEAVIAELSGPMDLTFDREGNLLVANQIDGNVISVDERGQLSVLDDSIPHPTGLAFGKDNTLYVLSATEGTLFRIDSMGDVQPVLRDLSSPSDLSVDRNGDLILCNHGSAELIRVSPVGSSRPFASVPRGTIGHALDGDGNIFLANWKYRFVMKITRNLSIRCPHCGDPIPLRFRPRPAPEVEGNPVASEGSL